MDVSSVSPGFKKRKKSELGAWVGPVASCVVLNLKIEKGGLH